MTPPLRIRGIIFLVVASAVASHAAAAELPQIGRDGAAWTVEVDGRVIARTARPVTSARSIAAPGNSNVLLWTEQGQASDKRTRVAVARSGQDFARPQTVDYALGLRYARFDPATETPIMPAAMRSGAKETLYLVQLVAAPLPEWTNALRTAGALPLRFMPETTWLVRANADALAALAALPIVRSISPYHPALRIAPELHTGLRTGAGSMHAVSIERLDEDAAAGQALAARVVQLGGAVINSPPDSRRITAVIPTAALPALSADDRVSFIEPWGPGGADMSVARQLGGAVPLLQAEGFTGEGVRAEILDLGIQTNHPQWGGKSVLFHGTPGPIHPHGTSVFGIIFATGSGSAAATGMAPGAEQGIFSWHLNASQFGGPVSRLTQNTEATDPNGPFRSILQSASVGGALTTAYNAISAETDDYLFKVDYLSVQSQSNDGTQFSRPQAWSKNLISVSGINHFNTVSRADDAAAVEASYGPAADGRIKPDLVHIFDLIFTTTNGSTYTQFCCTSGATPIVAGHLALLAQMWHEGVWRGHGQKATVFDSRPRSMTSKALIINGAYRYPLNQGGLTRNRQGWGMPDLTPLYAQADNTYVNNETHILGALGVNRYEFDVPAGAPELAVTLCYIDPPGNPAVQELQRVNDLTLKVTAPTGQIYWGNAGLLTSNYSSPNGEPDTINTVENVFLQNPAAGLWTVEVSADVLAEDSYLKTSTLDAAYALVFRGKSDVYVGCRGDVNVDGVIDDGDLGLLLDSFNRTPADPQYNGMADIDANGLVDGSDLGLMLTSFGMNCEEVG